MNRFQTCWCPKDIQRIVFTFQCLGSTNKNYLFYHLVCKLNVLFQLKSLTKTIVCSNKERRHSVVVMKSQPSSPWPKNPFSFTKFFVCYDSLFFLVLTKTFFRQFFGDVLRTNILSEKMWILNEFHLQTVHYF